MLSESLKEVCKKQNIKTAAGLHDRLKGTNAAYSYEVIRKLWIGNCKGTTFENVMRELGVTKLEAF